MHAWYVEANNVERERLRSLAARLSDDDLARQLDNGMTVAEALAHLAFWDEYCLSLLQQYEHSGIIAPGEDYHAVNAGVRAVARLVPAREALQLALDAADTVDEHVETIVLELARTIETDVSPRMLERAAHRREHLDQIDFSDVADGTGFLSLPAVLLLRCHLLLPLASVNRAKRVQQGVHLIIRPHGDTKIRPCAWR